jgi:hypothetical protein
MVQKVSVLQPQVLRGRNVGKTSKREVVIDAGECRSEGQMQFCSTERCAVSIAVDRGT